MSEKNKKNEFRIKNCTTMYMMFTNLNTSGDLIVKGQNKNLLDTLLSQVNNIPLWCWKGGTYHKNLTKAVMFFSRKYFVLFCFNRLMPHH